MKEMFSIFGNPVSHSMSPLMHNMAFKDLKIDACYGRYRLEDGAMLREKFFALGLRGINITVPYKEDAYRACDKPDAFARKVGAVNTIVQKQGILYGYNTDAPGFLKAISEFDVKRILFLGAGGTAQSTAIILRDEGYDVTILNRSAGRLERFKEDGFETFTFETFIPDTYDLIVNMTSAGLNDDHLPAPREILDSVIPDCKACVDVIYGRETPFLKLAKSYHKPSKDGSDMLLYQGAIAFEYFCEGKFKFDEILYHMKRAFEIN